MPLRTPGFWLAMLFLSCGWAHAQSVGRVLLAAGDVTVLRGAAATKLTPGAAVQDKDVLRTGAASNLQVRFSDESVISLRENSELRLEEFRFNGKEDGSERAFFNLVKGGLRAFTGLVGRSNNNNYRMSTSTATIGIRGTDYVAVLCEKGSCRNEDGSAAKDGLYGRVLGASHGTNRINVRNDAGERQFGINENFYVADNKSAIQPVIAPAGFLSGKLESRTLGGTAASGGGGTGTEQNAANGTQQDSRVTNPPVMSSGLTFVAPEAGTASGVSGYSPLLTPAIPPPPTIGFVGAWSSSSSTPTIGEGGGAFILPSMLTLNGSSEVTAATIPLGTTTFEDPGGFFAGTSAGSIVDTGSALAVNAYWGRWSGGSVTIDAGTSALPGGLHYLYGDLAPPEVVAAKTGTFALSQVGGTTPTDHTGALAGSSTYPALTLNFTTRTGTVGGFSWAFGITGTFTLSATSGNIVIAPGQGAAFIANGSGSCSGTGCGIVGATYNLTGAFLGAQGNHLGVQISMQTNTNNASAAGVRLYTCAPSC